MGDVEITLNVNIMEIYSDGDTMETLSNEDATESSSNEDATESSSNEDAMVSSSDENSVENRRVLAEIPITESSISHIHIGRIDGRVNIMSDEYEPYTNPDELIIQQRGRRKMPIVFSPDIDIIKQSKQEPTTELDSSSSNANAMVLKNTRKRLLMNDPLDLLSPSEDDEDELPDTKRPRVENVFKLSEDNNLLLALKALTSEQLIGIIGQLLMNHPDIKEEISSNFPVADLKPLEDRIYYLRSNIYKSLPKSRLHSKTDPVSYDRVSMHVLDFKKCVINQGKHLLESSQWPVVMDYVLMAWRYVRNTPIWENPSHNAARRQCFKSLSAQCMTALRHMKESLDQEKRDYYKNQLKSLTCDHVEDIELCLKFLDD